MPYTIGQEPDLRSPPELGGRTAFVVEDIRVRDPGAVIDHRVQVAATGAGLVGSLFSPWIRQPPPSGIPARFLTSSEQLARPVALVAMHRL